MAAAAFSIRDYAASMRCKTGAEGLLLLGIEDLPPLRAPRCRWWADELASAVAAAAGAASPRRAPGKAKPTKKRSISDLFAAAPPLAAPPAGDAGCKEQTEVDDDEALCAIARRAKEEKKRKRKLQEEEAGQKEETAAVAAAPESSGGREPKGNFAASKVRGPAQPKFSLSANAMILPATYFYLFYLVRIDGTIGSGLD
ncbi:uncharacterized protein LOC125531893 [Triticum urartu]|uniref:uncharacterized protein LOC125531893 n=1 Tax=Triticum urartu TaxID=4572 RepID=UPI00204372B6|nr:uncharacterized protein LOC125531893 [Triticum urartu]